jgi:hypothetical protein
MTKDGTKLPEMALLKYGIMLMTAGNVTAGNLKR